MKKLEYSCGLGSVRPAWMQRFANTKCFMVVYSLLGTVQGMSYIYMSTTLTTLEKRFKIPSQTIGILMSGNEVSQVFLSLAMSYHGGRGNRPLWISWGVTFSAISCFILALPHLVYGPGKDAIALTEEFLDTTVLNSSIPKTNDRALLCSGNRTASAYCQEDVSGGEHSLMPLILIFFSQFVLGIGTTLFHSLGQTYLDDHTKKTNAPLLLGMVLSLRMLGPAAGFAFSSFCLSLYIDPTLTPVIKPTDPRWLGAWWLAVCGALLVRSHTPQSLWGSPGSVTYFPIFLFVKVDVSNFFGVVRLDVGNSCNMGCDCDDLKYQPVCYREKDITFYSACHIGCNDTIHSKNGSTTSFTNCTCLPFTQDTTLLSGLSSSLTTEHPLYAKDLSAVMTNGPCPVDCTRILYTYILVGFFIQALSSSGRIGNVLVNFRCVKQKDKVFAQGLSLLLFKRGGGHPLNFPRQYCLTYTMLHPHVNHPNYFFPQEKSLRDPARCARGALGTRTVNAGSCLLVASADGAGFRRWLTLVTLSQYKLEACELNCRFPLIGACDQQADSSCLLWDASCGEKGNCWLYQKDKFRIYMNVTAAVLTSLGVILDIKVWHLGKTLDLYGDTDEHSSDDRRRSSAYRSRQVSLANRSRQPSLANRSRQPSIADRSRQGSVSDRSRRPSFVDSSGRPSVQNSRQPSLGNTSYKNSATDSSSIVDFSKNLSADDRPRTPIELYLLISDEMTLTTTLEVALLLVIPHQYMGLPENTFTGEKVNTVDESNWRSNIDSLSPYKISETARSGRFFNPFLKLGLINSFLAGSLLGSTIASGVGTLTANNVYNPYGGSLNSAFTWSFGNGGIYPPISVAPQLPVYPQGGIQRPGGLVYPQANPFLPQGPVLPQHTFLPQQPFLPAGTFLPSGPGTDLSDYQTLPSPLTRHLVNVGNAKKKNLRGPGTDLSDYQTLPSPLTRHLVNVGNARPPPWC
uniref:Kazal-like domain-containing protein n=1 Tax=Timema monikensis TaxID=170555 RepID=A0A7R9E782_9NEOP|nr:unnamed protein product [Timema monikensis]